MSILSHIQQIFGSLTIKERRILKRFLLVYSNVQEKNPSLLLQLYKLLEDKKKLSNEDECIFFIYGDLSSKSKDSYRKLLERFRERMLESMLFEDNLLEVDSFYSVSILPIIKSRKMLSKLQILRSRGTGKDKKELKKTLKEEIKIAEKFELFDELLILKRIYYEDISYQDFEYYGNARDLLKEIEIIREKNILVLRSRVYVNELIYDVQFKSMQQIAIISDLKNAINFLNEANRNFKIAKVEFNNFLLKIQYSHYIYDYLTAEKQLIELSTFIKNQEAVYSRSVLVESYMNLSYTQLYLYKFNDALLSMALIHPFYDSLLIDVRNFYVENEIFIHIYLQNYNKAERVALKILDSGFNMTPMNNYRCNYLLAVTYFLSKRYKESFRLLQDTKEIENDKEGWNLGVRMLQIYLTLDTDKVDLADQRIASLRKHIDRTSKLKTVRKRDIVILRIVNHLSRSGFDFKEVWEDRKKDFALLRSSDRDYLWEPRTHEMIVFDQWFESKVKGIDYQPKFPDPVE